MLAECGECVRAIEAELAVARQRTGVQIDGKRFFRTGDLDRTDEDGYFFLVDRLKRMILNAQGS